MGEDRSTAPCFAALHLYGPDQEGLLTVTLDSGLPKNQMTAGLHRDLSRLWPIVSAVPDVTAILLRGRPGGFSVGADPDYLRTVAASDADLRTLLLEEARAIVTGVLECPMPVVSAVRGGAVGAALGIALLSDVCVVADDALIADGHARLGVPAGDAVLAWPLLCGMAQAKRLLLLPEAVSGQVAAEIGLVSECVADGDVDGHAETLARRLAAAPPAATRWTKRTLNHWYRAALPAFDASLALEMLAYGHDDAVARVASIGERGPRG